MFQDPQQQQTSNPAVFACIIPSRPVQTNVTHLPPNRFIFQFEDPGSINHLVVFLTGIVPLPEGYGASIHFQFPNKPDWQLSECMLSGTKPSAIFRLKGTMVPSQLDWASSGMTDMPTALATLGILPSTSSLPQLAKAIGLNLFRYLASFSSTTFDNQTWIPISVLEKCGNNSNSSSLIRLTLSNGY
ncbi:hypothetical protein H4Q26_011502 [Puccinia striiformis f. sp. tritici PST-130]|nr:hypothetical protein H4Q26_011502 [Puccinia striiformis f. sp. tritici PST-130]